MKTRSAQYSSEASHNEQPRLLARLIWAWCVTTIVATLCFLTGWVSAGEPAAPPSPAAGLAQHTAAPHRDSGSEKREQSGSVLSYDAQTRPAVLIGMLEPQFAGGTGTRRPRIAPAPFTGQAPEPSTSSHAYEPGGDFRLSSHDPVTGQDQKTPPFGILSCPQGSQCSPTDTGKVNGGNAISGATDLSVADLRMPVDGVTAHFRPLLEIHLGAHELPIFLYSPDPQNNWPRQ
jgi:hypothetical protein